MGTVLLEGICKNYPNGVVAIDHLNLQVAGGEFFALLGPSGSGKSTLLRLIAGLELMDKGSVWIDGRDVSRLAPRDRNLAVVFQNPALLPHLTVFENMAFGLRAGGQKVQTVRKAVEDMAERLRLTGILSRKPRTLSGGQKQRVALGRAFVRKPAVFLLDEPLSSLDESLREEIRLDLIAAHRRLGATIIHVTHDQKEALTLGDRVGLMQHGKLAQTGTPRDLYARPCSRPVAGFVGEPAMKFLSVIFENRSGIRFMRIVGLPALPTDLPLAECWASQVEKFAGRTIELGLRPEHVKVHNGSSDRDPAFAWTGFHVSLVRSEYQGYSLLLTLENGLCLLHARAPVDSKHLLHTTVEIGFDLSRASFFASDSGIALSHGTP